MNIFDTHGSIVGDYREYIESFINISDPPIEATVSNELRQGKLWPEPLLHFNPSFEESNPIKSLVAENLLHRDFARLHS